MSTASRSAISRRCSEKYQSDLQEVERKLMGKLQNEITSLVSDIAKKDGYLLVISNIGVIYALPSIDITERLIQELNAKAGKKAGITRSTPGPAARRPARPGTEAPWKPCWTSWPSCSACRTATRFS